MTKSPSPAGSSFLEEFARLTNRHCPVCGKTGWCLIHRTGTYVLCQRVESARKYGNAGWRHDMSDVVDVPPLCETPPILSSGTVWSIWKKEQERLTEEKLDELAFELKLPAWTLKALGVGLSYKGYWGFPMFVDNSIVGIRYRKPDGQKRSLRGGKEGLFVPNRSVNSLVLVTEGPSDTAAAVSLGVSAVGRASCAGREDAVKSYLQHSHGPNIFIVADNDGPGTKGAISLQKHLKKGRVIVPAAFKDLRHLVTSTMYTATELRACLFKLQKGVADGPFIYV